MKTIQEIMNGYHPIALPDSNYYHEENVRKMLKEAMEDVVDECASVCIMDEAIREDVERIKEQIQ